MSSTPLSVPPIVSARWLAEHVADVVICEVGSSMTGGDPEARYAERHIRGARYISLDTALAAPPSAAEGRHPLPSPEDFARDLGALGIDDEATVVAYDRQGGGGIAGRLVWMLRAIGQPAALLDGGLGGWDGPVDSEPVESEPVIIEPIDGEPVARAVRQWPANAVADADDVARHIRAGGVVIDSRAPDRYAGDVEPIDAVAGHIPGAINLVYTENLDAEFNFRPTAELAERFAVAAHDNDPIVYCGSGVTACHNALVMEHLGLRLPRLYVGSWSAWSADIDRPVGSGPTP